MSTIKAKNIKQTVIGGTTQPLKIGGILEDGSDAKLTIGTDGSASFQGNVKTANSIKPIFEYTTSVSGYSFTMNGISLVSGKKYRLYIESAGNGGDCDIFLFFNGVLTAASYYSQLISQDNSSIYGTRVNIPLVGTVSNGVGSSIIVDFAYDISNYIRSFFDASRGAPSSISNRRGTMVNTFSTNKEITSITINSSGNNMVAGSKFTLIELV